MAGSYFRVNRLHMQTHPTAFERKKNVPLCGGSIVDLLVRLVSFACTFAGTKFTSWERGHFPWIIRMHLLLLWVVQGLAVGKFFFCQTLLLIKLDTDQLLNVPVHDLSVRGVWSKMPVSSRCWLRHGLWSHKMPSFGGPPWFAGWAFTPVQNNAECCYSKKHAITSSQWFVLVVSPRSSHGFFLKSVLLISLRRLSLEIDMLWHGTSGTLRRLNRVSYLC